MTVCLEETSFIYLIGRFSAGAFVYILFETAAEIHLRLEKRKPAGMQTGIQQLSFFFLQLLSFYI